MFSNILIVVDMFIISMASEAKYWQAIGWKPIALKTQWIIQNTYKLYISCFGWIQVIHQLEVSIWQTKASANIKYLMAERLCYVLSYMTTTLTTGLLLQEVWLEWNEFTKASRSILQQI